MELIVVLLTGLTTGGLTCLAVQGGLLASVVSAGAGRGGNNVAGPVASAPARGASRNKQRKPTAHAAAPPATGGEAGRGPVLAFLAAKLLAYTVLGILLGATGSLIGVSPTTRGWLQLAAGLYMVGTALNLLEVHPIFRYLVLQPPSFLTRRVRLASKSSNVLAPAFLGFMTVLIPCGTTLAVEFLALSTGDPLYAGALLFAFILGTMPIFYALGRFATGLSGEKQARFMGFTAAAVLFLGALSINTSMNLLDYPLTYDQVEAKLASLPRRITGQDLGGGSASDDSTPQFALAPTPPHYAGLADGASEAAPTSGVPISGDAQVLHLTVKSTAYTPSKLTAKANQAIRLELATSNTDGCTRGFTIPSLGIQKVLPTTGTTVVEIPAQKPGTLHYTCVMGMYSGTIVIS